MKHVDLKKLYLKHNEEMVDYLKGSTDDELYDSYNELNKAYKEDDFNANNELEIYDELVDIINEEISYRWIKEYKKDHKIK